jgi:hypothetical protein
VHAGFRPFGSENFNSITGKLRGAEAPGVDAVEVINSGAMQSEPMLPFHDWMALRNRGERITAVASSDSHDVARYIVGQGRTYIVCPDRDPAKIKVTEACRSLQEGRALVSLGLLAEMTVDDRYSVGDVATGLGSRVKVTVRVLGPSWVDADRVELYSDGIKVREQVVKSPAGSAEKALIEWILPRPAHDVWLVAIASGPGVTSPHWAIARPYQPTSTAWRARVLAATNPVELDVDGDGKWTSPRDYARSILKGVGDNATPLVAALAAYDEAVAIQAAELYHAAGHDVLDAEFSQALEQGKEPVRRAFAKFVRGLRP